MKSLRLSLFASITMTLGALTGNVSASSNPSRVSLESQSHPMFLSFVQVHFIKPVNSASVSGNVEIALTIDDSTTTVSHVDYYLDGDGGQKVAQWNKGGPAYYYAQFDASHIASGYHSLGAHVYDSYGNQQFNYVGIYVGTGSVHCPDLQVEIRNLSSRAVVGGVWGTHLGSSGWNANPYTTTHVGVSADRASSYNVTLQVLSWPSTPVTCAIKVPSVNECPIPGGAIGTIYDTGNASSPIVCNLWTY